MSLTVSSYLRGHRTAEGSKIPFNPFYNATHHRYSAAAYVQTYRLPVLRNSSVDGFYAITHMYGHRVLHTLLRQNGDGSVDVMSETGAVLEHYETLYAILDRILLNSSVVLDLRVPAASVASSHGTRDPIEVVVVCSEDPT